MEEIVKKYKHTDKIPYWRNKECDELIDKILTDEKIKEKYCFAGKERVSLFSWKKTASEYLELFKNV